MNKVKKVCLCVVFVWSQNMYAASLHEQNKPPEEEQTVEYRLVKNELALRKAPENTLCESASKKWTRTLAPQPTFVDRDVATVEKEWARTHAPQLPVSAEQYKHIVSIRGILFNGIKVPDLLSLIKEYLNACFGEPTIITRAPSAGLKHMFDYLIRWRGRARSFFLVSSVLEARKEPVAMAKKSERTEHDYHLIEEYCADTCKMLKSCTLYNTSEMALEKPGKALTSSMKIPSNGLCCCLISKVDMPFMLTHTCYDNVVMPEGQKPGAYVRVHPSGKAVGVHYFDDYTSCVLGAAFSEMMQCTQAAK